VSELERMAHGVLMASFAGPVVPPWLLARLEVGLGSVALFPSNVQSSSQVRPLTDALREAASGVLVATDEEAGDVTRLHVATGSPWPGNAALGVVDDVRRTELVAAGVGAELVAAGIDLDLAPVVDVNSNSENPVIGVRSFGASAELVARQAGAFVAGLKSAGVGACAKHFPGHGDTAVDSHLGLPVVDASLEVLRERELVPFAAAVAAGSVAVMTSHVVLPALDAGLPATLSAPVVDVLRSELGFDGVVVTDALDMAGVSAGRGLPAAAVAALAAGCDLLCLGADGVESDVEAVVAAIVASVRTGELAEERLASAEGRVRSARRRIDRLREAAGAEPVAVLAAAGAAGPVDVANAVAAELAAGHEVARAAVAVDGALPDLRGVPVIRFRTGLNLAVGQVPWGLPLDGSVQGGHHPVDVTETTDVEEVMREAMSVSGQDGGPIVALVRDAHRHPWVLEALRRLDHWFPHLVTVEMGWPGCERLPGRTQVRTYGAARANCEALDEVLAGAGPVGSAASRPPGAPRPPVASRPPAGS